VTFASTQVRAALIAALLVPSFAAVATAQALPDAKSLMEKHNAAVGGRAALDGHTSVKMSGTMEIAAMGLSAAVEVFRAKPNKYLQRISISQLGEVLSGYDGKTGWGINPGAPPQIMEGEALESHKANADFFAGLQDLASYAKAETVELTDWQGKKCYKVNATRGTREGTQYFDAATGLLAGFVVVVPTPQGPTETSTIFVEYADFGGFKMAKRIEQRTPQFTSVISFSSVEYDKVDPATFDLPASVKAMVKP